MYTYPLSGPAPSISTYGDAVLYLGTPHVRHLWRQSRIEDCIAEVRNLKIVCGQGGSLYRTKI